MIRKELEIMEKRMNKQKKNLGDSKRRERKS